MSAAGDFIRKPDRRVKLLITMQLVWVATLVVLAVWWGTLLYQKSDEIANLQTQLGVSEPKVQAQLDKSERMIRGESGTFILLILLTHGVLGFFFLRDSRRSRSLQAFFASFTHELRTPLTSIKLQAEALRDIEDNPKHTPFINRLLEDAERLEGQVQRSLELARLEGGGSLNLQSVQIKSFVQNKVRPSFTYSESKLQLQIALQEAIVSADTTALTMIFRNVVDNAVKYSTAQPAILNITGESDAGLYHLTFTHENSAFQGESKNLGTLFYRGQNSQGAGVGLYLIETLASKMKAICEFDPRTSGKFITRITLRQDQSEVARG